MIPCSAAPENDPEHVIDPHPERTPQPVSFRETIINRILPRVQTPGQYIGGEWNSIRKDPGTVRGRICLAFPDKYTIGMSHYGLQVLYHVMNSPADWACERVFAPGTDLEGLLHEHGYPLFSLETYSPLREFDVLGFTLQYELCATNILTILDLGGIPLDAGNRALSDPLVIAGGPCAMNPEPWARFIDVFLPGDGEEILPALCDWWLDARGAAGSREEALAEIASKTDRVYVPRFYEPTVVDGRPGPPRPLREGVPGEIHPSVVEDLDAAPIPLKPIVPFVETVHDRMAIEIMRGCPGACRFCQSTSIKRPVRWRSIESIVDAAEAMYHATGHNELSLLSLSSSDYPDFESLLRRLNERLAACHVSLSVPSLRVNKQWRTLTDLLGTQRHSGLTLAPEAASEEMRRWIGKPIKDEDLLAGCRNAFEKGFRRVKLYFMCGFPDETEEDLRGIVTLSETVSRLGKETFGRFAEVTANVSNFVPKPHTPFQWHAMQSREYFRWAHRFLVKNKRLRSIQIKYHDLETSLLEAAFCRGDRRFAEAIETAWREGARFDAWSEHARPELWWKTFADLGIDIDRVIHSEYPLGKPLPWEFVQIHGGSTRLRERFASV